MMHRTALASWLFGLLLLSALIGFVMQMGEIGRFMALARQVDARWLALCLTLQFGTYLCESLSWQLLLLQLGHPFPLARLLPLSVVKLFSDQALPSAGLSGSAFFVAAMRRRGVPAVSATSCMLADLATYFLAYACLTAGALLALELRDARYRWLLLPGGAVIVLQGAIPAALWYMQRSRRLPGARLLARHPWLRIRAGNLRQAVRRAQLRRPLIALLVLLHACILLLDAATLWTILRALGVAPQFIPVFACFIVASVVMSASPVPLGLGTFESSCVAMLHSIGIGLEAGLTATLLLRGMTTWMPMLPGMWLIRHEIQRPSGARP